MKKLWIYNHKIDNFLPIQISDRYRDKTDSYILYSDEILRVYSDIYGNH